jgi:hypothetical protein
MSDVLMFDDDPSPTTTMFDDDVIVRPTPGF